MVYEDFKSLNVWTWNDLNKKVVQVISVDANPETLEPAITWLVDVESKIIYVLE